ncbi:HEAT repeat domain-containing protein [Methanogenium organophilum]|uniref:HEAT repeat domain-containing protein n=1 Tax=Methanogenium organophilum TaxID=2199 RepID=A0A9X9T7R2_METOG|nr:HEAT repeat domain-containing protein [Methanogenium organophilum]WAI00671.1 HEAT repeat domain-containing protein [Methanogenium organophilum]
MGFFRRSEPTLEQCIESREYQCIVRYFLKGIGGDAATALRALLILSERDPQSVADVLDSLSAGDMKNAALGIVQSGGPDHPAVFALARHVGPEMGRALGRAAIRCGDDAFDAIVTGTGSQDRNTRLGAIFLLGYIGKAGIPVLKEKLYHTDGEEQRTAATCLRSLDWAPEKPEEKPVFFYLCEDWNELLLLKEHSLPLLFSLVKENDPDLKRHAIQTLGEIGDRRAISVILPCVDDRDPEVRIAAVSAIARFDSPDTERLLVNALNHNDSQIRIEAAHALKRKGWIPKTRNEQIRSTIAGGNWDAVKGFGGMVVPDLIRVVRTGDNEWQGAVHALTELGPAAVQELKGILPSLPESQQKTIISIFRKSEEKHRLRRENIHILYHADGEEQRNAARFLHHLGWTPKNPDEKPMFFFLCGDWDELIGLKEKGLSLLLSLLKKDDPAQRKHALQALGEIGDSRAVPAILSHVDDRDPEVRIAAVSALACYDTFETEQLLVRALQHDDSQVRIDVAHALRRKGWAPRTQGDQMRYTIARGNWDAVIKLGVPVIPDLIRIVSTEDNEWPGAVYALAELGPDAAHELQMILPSLPKSQQKAIVSVFRKSEEKHRLRRENIQKLYHADGEEQRNAARFLHNLGWTPENPDEKPMFFFLSDDWDELIGLKERALPFLLSLVKRDDPAQRRRALLALGEIGDSRAVPAILPCVDDRDPEVRIAAVSALMHFDTADSLQRLEKALGHADSQVRIDAAHALKRHGWTPRTRGDQIRYTIARGNWDAVIKLGVPVIPDLIRIVRTGDNEWPGAVYALAGLGSDASQELENILPPLPESRQKEIVSLFRKSEEKHRLRREQNQKMQEAEKEMIPATEEVKGPSESEMRETQKRVLEGFKWLRLQKIATEQIYAIIKEGVEVHNISFEMAVAALSSRDEAIRAAAIDVLSMKGERAYSYIMKAAYDRSQIVRTAVADALGSIGQPSMIKMLSLLSKDPSVEVRLATVRSLEIMNNDRAFPYILNLFSDEDAVVRGAAAHAAATYGQFGLPLLIQSLQRQGPDIRIAAATALGEICDVRSLEFLIPHLEDSDSRVREAIRAAIVMHDYRAIEPLKIFIAGAEGEVKNAALLALYEIDPSLAGEDGADIHLFEEAFAAAENADAIIGFHPERRAESSDGTPPFNAPPSGDMVDEVYDSRNVCMDSHICEELVIRIEGGDESLSSALLVDLYDEDSSLKRDLISAMKGSDRAFAMHAATLLSKIGWSPEDAEEESLFLLATGKTTLLKEGGAKTAHILLELVPTMPSSVQNTIVEIFLSIGGRDGIFGLAHIVTGGYGAISDKAAESLAEMDAGAIPFIREAASSKDDDGKRCLEKIIQKIER